MAQSRYEMFRNDRSAAKAIGARVQHPKTGGFAV
jgi:hypothetical protein